MATGVSSGLENEKDGAFGVEAGVSVGREVGPGSGVGSGLGDGNGCGDVSAGCASGAAEWLAESGVEVRAIVSEGAGATVGSAVDASTGVTGTGVSVGNRKLIPG